MGSLNCSFIHSTQVLLHIFGGSGDSYFQQVVVYCCIEKEVCRHAQRPLSRQNQPVRTNSDRKQTTIWNFDKPKRNANHPTSKPLDLLSYPIGNSTQENGVVIDTFGGSGSTLMACEQMNRICYTMELDEKYASVILRRYVEDTGDADGVYVIRDGQQIPYCELVKEVEKPDE